EHHIRVAYHPYLRRSRHRARSRRYGPRRCGQPHRGYRYRRRDGAQPPRRLTSRFPTAGRVKRPFPTYFSFLSISMSTSRQHQGHFARKRFGQNFLVDLGIIDSIVALIAPERGQRMVEIGPGLGALTEPLGERLAMHAGDALAFDFSSLVETHDKPTLRIVGNLPYNISSPLLFHLMSFASVVIDQHFMLQNEVVERMVAEPGTKAFSRLSVMLQYRYVMEKMLDVPPESFQPPPKV